MSIERKLLMRWLSGEANEMTTHIPLLIETQNLLAQPEQEQEPISEDEIQDALIKHRRSTIWDYGFKVGVKYAEQKHGISGGGDETM